jgi:hypothetical protein
MGAPSLHPTPGQTARLPRLRRHATDAQARLPRRAADRRSTGEAIQMIYLLAPLFVTAAWVRTTLQKEGRTERFWDELFSTLITSGVCSFLIWLVRG